MSEYAVHFTRPAAVRSAYEVMMSILSSGTLRAGGPFGAARTIASVRESQRSVCFSEIPLDLLDRLIARRSLYGIGFRQDFLIQRGGARVWYLDKDGAVDAAMIAIVQYALSAGANPVDPIWKLTPFTDYPGTYGATQYRFEWEREWRVPGGLPFAAEDVAFLFIPEEQHGAARAFFEEAARENTGPAYLCPYVDPRWEMESIQSAFAVVPPAPTQPPGQPAGVCAYCGGPSLDAYCVLCGQVSP